MVTIISKLGVTSGKKEWDKIKKTTNRSQPVVVALAALHWMLGTVEFRIAFCISVFAH